MQALLAEWTCLEKSCNLLRTSSIPRGKTLILDASFNPPTLAHLGLLTQATQLLKYDTVCLLFTTRNADKGLTTNLQERLDWMERLSSHVSHPHVVLGITNVPKFVDKATLMHSNHPLIHSHFLMGRDTLVRFLDPKYYSKSVDDMARVFLNAQSTIVYADRCLESESHSTECQDVFQGREWLKQHFIHLPTWTRSPYSHVSSTLARACIQEYQSTLSTESKVKLKTLLPLRIVESILKQV